MSRAVVSCFHLFKARNVSFTEASASSFPARHPTAPVGKLSFYFCVFSRAQTTTDSIHIHKHVQTELTDILQQTNAVGCPAFHLKRIFLFCFYRTHGALTWNTCSKGSERVMLQA